MKYSALLLGELSSMIYLEPILVKKANRARYCAVLVVFISNIPNVN